jgi:hypothetical protein
VRAAATAALAAALLALSTAAAAASDNPADEPPFGGETPPPLVHPPSERVAPPGFRLSARQAIRVADRAPAVAAERASGALHAVALERGDRW